MTQPRPYFMELFVGKGWMVTRRIREGLDDAFPTGVVHRSIEACRAEREEQEKLERAKQLLGE